MAEGLRVGAAYVDIEGRLSRDFDRDLENEGGSRMKAVGGKLGGILAGGIAAVGAAAGVALAKGAFDAIGQEAGSDRLAAQLGINDPQFAAELGDVAGDLYADNFGDSVEEANAAIRAVWQEGLLPEDATNAQLEAVSGKVLNLADVFEQDLGGTASAVGQLLKTGLAKDATEALDVITRGFQQGVDKRGDFLDTLNEYGTQFRKLGLDAGTATGLMSQGLKAGARDADLVADSLKEFSIRAIDGSKLTAEGFERIGLNAGSMARAIANGGDEAADALDMTLDALRAMEDPIARDAAAVALFGTQSEDLGAALLALDPGTAVNALGDVTGAADKMGETLSGNTAAKIETFKRQALQGLADFVGGHLIPAVEKFAPVVEGVVALVAAKWPEIQAAILPVVEGIVAFVQENWPQISATIQEVMTSVAETVATVLELVAFIWNQYGAQITEVVRTTFTGALRVIDGVMQVIRGIVDVVMGLMTGDWSRAWDGIKSIVSGVWDFIAGFIEINLARIKLIVVVALDVLKSLIAAPLSVIAGIFRTVWEGITGAVRTAWEGIKGIVSGGLDAIVGFFTGIGARIDRLTSGMWDGIKNAFRAAINFIIRGWNRLEFRIPGFDVGPVSFGGQTIGMPNIPELAEGGIVAARPGGTLARIAEANEDEVVAPLSDLLGYMNRALDGRFADAGRSGPTINIEAHVSDQVDLDLLLHRTAFLASAGAFG